MALKEVERLRKETADALQAITEKNRLANLELDRQKKIMKTGRRVGLNAQKRLKPN